MTFHDLSLYELIRSVWPTATLCLAASLAGSAISFVAVGNRPDDVPGPAMCVVS